MGLYVIKLVLNTAKTRSAILRMEIVVEDVKMDLTEICVGINVRINVPQILVKE